MNKLNSNIHKCPNCEGRGYEVYPSLQDENEPEQVMCGVYDGTGEVYEFIGHN